MSDKEKGKVRYINKILKAKVSPARKGELMEESKTSTYGYLVRLIKMMEANPTWDVVQCKIELKNNLIKLQEEGKKIQRKMD
tara:strand:- start:610 stop:855 length:246 start_codon:yes stop_codon:yes gene_type:complete